MRPHRALIHVLALLCTALGTGCGDPDLWARYQAEREYWRAGRAIEKIRVNPRLARDEDYARAAAAFQRVADDFPARRWAVPAALATPYGLDIATLSGRAAVAALQIREVRGGVGVPAAYARIADAYSAVPEVRREALTALARALQVSDRHAEAAAAWIAVWTESEPVDARRVQVDEMVLAAPLGAARALRLSDRADAADSLLRAARARLVSEAMRWAGKPPATALWRQAAEAAEGAGDHDGAIAALRGALGEEEARDFAPSLIEAIAGRHLSAGRPDSALVYTAWAIRDFGSTQGVAAQLLAVSAWQRLGQPDSALARLDRVLDGVRLGSEAWVQGRFGRAEVLERMGRWELARGEYRAVIAGAPSHPLGLRAQVAIVRHHAAAGETALAEIEGRRALETVDRVLVISHDDSVQVAAQRCRGEMLEALGEVGKAIGAYEELWRGYRRSAAAAQSGWRAASLAEQHGERERALKLYRELTESVEPELRIEARRALRRLGVEKVKR